MKNPTHITELDAGEIMRAKVRVARELEGFLRDMARMYPDEPELPTCFHTEFRPGCPACEYEFNHGGEEE